MRDVIPKQDGSGLILYVHIHIDLQRLYTFLTEKIPFPVNNNYLVAAPANLNFQKIIREILMALRPLQVSCYHVCQNDMLSRKSNPSLRFQLIRDMVKLAFQLKKS